MTGKKRFDFGVSEFAAKPATASSEVETSPKKRLGPMAAAIKDSGEASQEFRANLQVGEIETLELAVQMKQLRRAKLDLRLLSLDAIDEGYLARDRTEIESAGLEELKASIRANGLGSPIRVDQLEGERYGLNQGRRRLVAFRELYRETGDDAFSKIPALVDVAGERDSAYRRMVDENLIREDVSYAEMAMLGVAYSEESGRSVEDAISILYASASDSKRSHIAAFARLFAALGDTIRFPKALPRNLGVELAGKVRDPAMAEAVRATLLSHSASTAEEERVILEGIVSANSASSRARSASSTPKTTKFRMMVGPGRKRRVDVAIAQKRLVISGFTEAEIDVEALRAFIEAMAVGQTS
jgi:ParB family chromosome partitioning protein